MTTSAAEAEAAEAEAGSVRIAKDGRTGSSERHRIEWRALEREAQRRFGVTEFRPGQRELIECALTGRDSLGILPTGAGKSLCYQLPALFLKGAVVVVSPLIALMQDQHERLTDANIESARLDSTVSEREQREQEEALSQGEIDLVLLTPERLQQAENLAPLKERGVSLFVVDEAHCVSLWGHDFRPAYLELRHAIEQLGRPPVMALTATAPPDRVEDILEQLGIPDARVVQGSIERENLFLEVFRTVNRHEKEERLLAILEEEKGPGIVYATTVRRVNELHEWLQERGIDACRYHGRLRKSEREQAQQRFMSGESRLIVATSAFGLGVDKPDVRFVVHWNFPESIENYYQEAGRAGRDGERARCALFYQLEDKRVHSFFIGGKHPHADEVKRFIQAFSTASQSAPKGVVRLDELAAATGLSENRVRVIASSLETLDVIVRRAGGRKLVRAMTEGEAASFVASFDLHFEADRTRLRTMMHYAETAGCRMQFVREYFGELPGERCNHCDNCTHPIEQATSKVTPLREVRARRRAARSLTTQATARRRARSGAIPTAEPVEAPQPPSSAGAPASDHPAYRRGQRVRHSRFGLGDVLETSNDEVSVAFPRYGERRVLASYLRPVEAKRLDA